jgi:recombinational DNA repair protein (RecF pathway)
VEKTEKFQPILLDGLILALLSLLGFKPIFEHCVICEKQYKDLVQDYLSGKAQNEFGFYFGGGGLICADCRNKKEYTVERIFNFDLKEINGLQLLLKGNWNLMNEFEFEEKEKKALHKLIYEFVLFHSEKKMFDWEKFLQN